MIHRFKSSARAGRILLVLALFAALVSSASAFNNGQKASLVLGQPDFTTSAPTTSAIGMSTPAGVAVDPTTGKIFIADEGNSRVLRFASGAALISGAAAERVLGQPDFTTSAPTTSAIGMRQPYGVAVDSAGTLWVADGFNSRVLRFDNAATLANGAPANGVLGQINFTDNSSATTQSRMKLAYGVTMDGAGTLWVADQGNHRVLRFDNAAGKANGANADGVLGQLLFTSGLPALSASRMSFPYGIALDSGGRLWVADSFNQRVLRFDGAASKTNGANADGVLGQANFTTNATTLTADGMNNPQGVALDSTGSLWVADTGNSRVLRFDGAASKANGANADGVLGQPDFTHQDAATSASRMNSPSGVALDSVNNLWVADFQNNRVLRFEPPLTWAASAAITYGTALSATQLNASGSVPGTYTYTPAMGALLNAGVGQTLSVLFTPTDLDHYSTATLTVTIDVAQANQTITFATPATKTFGDAPFNLSATAGSSLAVTFSSGTPAVCTVSGSTVTLLAAGACTITAGQAGDTNYIAAPSVSQTFTVSSASQTITFGALATKTVGAAPFTISATASSGLTVAFSSSTPSVCTISGSTVTLLAAGSCTITANQAGDTNYSAAPPVVRSFMVATDSDGDGIPDNVECASQPCVDSDGDSTPDSLDSDSDGDGVPDNLECAGQPCRDTDSDGKADYRDADDDGDGMPTFCPTAGGGQECLADQDGDGIPAYLDPNDAQNLLNGGDSDGDGIPDNAECATGVPCVDSNGDGVPNYADSDDDGDGILTRCPTPGTGQECMGDQDVDGIPDYLDSSDANAKRLYLSFIQR